MQLQQLNVVDVCGAAAGGRRAWLSPSCPSRVGNPRATRPQHRRGAAVVARGPQTRGLLRETINVRQCIMAKREDDAPALRERDLISPMRRPWRRRAAFAVGLLSLAAPASVGAEDKHGFLYSDDAAPAPAPSYPPYPDYREEHFRIAPSPAAASAPAPAETPAPETNNEILDALFSGKSAPPTYYQIAPAPGPQPSTRRKEPPRSFPNVIQGVTVARRPPHPVRLRP